MENLSLEVYLFDVYLLGLVCVIGWAEVKYMLL
jgi:hypothetical protein